MGVPSRGAIAALLGAAALLAGGCGDDDEGGPTEQPTPQQTATATATASPTPADEPSGSESCGQVTFTPQTDHGAFGIEATGTSCDTARAVARAAEGEETAFSAEGFDCTGEPDTSRPLPSTSWRCTSADAAVTFETS